MHRRLRRRRSAAASRVTPWVRCLSWSIVPVGTLRRVSRTSGNRTEQNEKKKSNNQTTLKMWMEWKNRWDTLAVTSLPNLRKFLKNQTLFFYTGIDTKVNKDTFLCFARSLCFTRITFRQRDTIICVARWADSTVESPQGFAM